MQPSDEDGAGGVDWAAVRHHYEAGELPLCEIRERFGITQYQLLMARLRGGWETRPQVATPGANHGHGAVCPDRLQRRILRIAEARLTAHEEAVARGEPGLLTVKELALLSDMTNVGRGARHIGAARGGRIAAAPRRHRQNTEAVGGGFATAEEARAADVAFMRAELIRRMDVLAAALRRGEALPDRFMRGRGEADGGP
jgi:hypothetical protein